MGTKMGVFSVFSSVSHEVSNSTRAILLERSGLVQNHLLLFIMYQMVYCREVAPTDHPHASLWNEIFFLEERIWEFD